MPNFFYYDANGQKQGPFNGQQLQELATQGAISPTTPLETDGGQKGTAGQIRGLNFNTVAPPPFAPIVQPVSIQTQSINLFCTNCGSPVSEHAITCPSCGANPFKQRKFCRRCGIALNPDQGMCIKCGAAISSMTKGNQKSRIAAALLALFLGGIGIHKFYLGSWGWGLIYLIFCWTYVPALLGLIEAIIYLTKSDEAFAEKYSPETQSAWRW